MGCCFSCNGLSSKFNNIRIVHLNGLIEEFDYPVTVSEVSGQPAKHFVFTTAQLLSPASIPLKPDTVLEAGNIYFMLPHSLFNSNTSPLDLAPVTRKLASMATNNRSQPNSRKQSLSPTSPVSNETRHDTKDSSKSRSWKPLLETIRERSFNRRSESDLTENAKLDGAETERI